jgi:CBS domain-containing protein
MITVAEVMSSELITVAPSTSVTEAARAMSLGGVGSALVMDGDRASGIFTERDILRALAQENADVGRTSRVDDWMSRDPVAVGPETTVGEALDIMLAHGFRHLVVQATSGAAQGVVSMRDLAGRIDRP